MKSVKVTLVLVTAAVGTVLGAAPANADTHMIIHVTAKAPVIEAALRFESDAPPVACRLVVRNLDSFGTVGANARVFTTRIGELTKSLGGFKPGDRIRAEGSCSDRAGDVDTQVANGFAR